MLALTNAPHKVLGRTYRSDPDPARKQQTRVLEPAREGEGGEGEVGVYYIDGEETNYGGLWGIVDEPGVYGQRAVCPIVLPSPSCKHTIETLSNQ